MYYMFLKDVPGYLRVATQDSVSCVAGHDLMLAKKFRSLTTLKKYAKKWGLENFEAVDVESTKWQAQRGDRS